MHASYRLKLDLQDLSPSVHAAKPLLEEASNKPFNINFILNLCRGTFAPVCTLPRCDFTPKDAI